MIVYSNTTPLISLASIDRLDLLPALFPELRVVDSVAEECAAGESV